MERRDFVKLSAVSPFFFKPEKAEAKCKRSSFRILIHEYESPSLHVLFKKDTLPVFYDGNIYAPQHKYSNLSLNAVYLVDYRNLRKRLDGILKIPYGLVNLERYADTIFFHVLHTFHTYRTYEYRSLKTSSHIHVVITPNYFACMVADSHKNIISG